MGGHFDIVAEAMLEGNVVPFLGAGVNLWDPSNPPPRPPGGPVG
jgi:hypothetical protein